MVQESTGTGRWAEGGVPHRGWKCVDIVDLEDDRQVCEMCQSREVRFAHVMLNPRFDGELRVGCVCAGHMEGDVQAAALRERRLKGVRARRAKWLSRTWRVSAAGNVYINVDGFRVVAFRRGRGWGASITHKDSGYVLSSNRYYATSDGVKLAAFDAMVDLAEHRPWAAPEAVRDRPRRTGHPDAR